MTDSQHTRSQPSNNVGTQNRERQKRCVKIARGIFRHLSYRPAGTVPAMQLMGTMVQAKEDVPENSRSIRVLPAHRMLVPTVREVAGGDLETDNTTETTASSPQTPRNASNQNQTTAQKYSIAFTVTLMNLDGNVEEIPDYNDASLCLN